MNRFLFEATVFLAKFHPPLSHYETYDRDYSRNIWISGESIFFENFLGHDWGAIEDGREDRLERDPFWGISEFSRIAQVLEGDDDTFITRKIVG